MHPIINLMLAVISFIASLPMAAQVAGGGITVGGYPVSQTEAFNVLQTNFPEEEVDYYLMDGYSLSEWTFFVDADPKASWTHTCYVATVPKTKAAFATSPVVRLSERTYPPEASYIPLKLIQKGPSWKHTDIPSTDLNINLPDNPYKNNIYVLIIHGNRTTGYDFQENLNDCSFIYTTLTKTYQIPKDNIYPLMYDKTLGIDSTRSVEFGDSDLDGDGEREPHLTNLSRENLKYAIIDITDKIHKDDMFFLFVTGAGGCEEFNDSIYSTIFLLDEESESVRQDDLEQNILAPIKEKEAVINLVFGQSHSGGFVEQFSKEGYVVVSACTKDEEVHVSPDAPYSEFLYRWTSAIAGYKLVPGSDGKPIQIFVNADADNDGYVSMEEAFNYAKSNDKFLNNAEHRETPQYFSSPSNLGKVLAFNRIPTECDLYIRDNEEDCGSEPNTSTTKYWDSPDIWVRNSNDNGSTHQNPEYSSDHTKAYIKVRVHNSGYNAYTSGKWLHISWAQSATTYHPAVWNNQTGSQMPTSGKLAAIPIGSIPARSERIVTGEWDLPAYLLDNTSFFSKNSFCIFAEITDSPDDSSATRWERLQILASNDAAQKNTTVIKQNEVLDFVNLLVRNNTQQQGNYSIEVLPREESDADFYTKGFVEISIPNDTYTSLSNNGLQIYNGSSYLSGNATVCKFGSPASSLSHVLLKPGETKEVQIRFNFVVTPKENKTYRFDVIQRDASSHIVGGMTFEIESPCDQVLYPFSISSASDENGGMNLSVDNESFRHIEWRNVNNETIGTQESINVRPCANNDRFSVAGVTEEGELGMATISFEGAYGIKALTCENSGKLKVTLHEAAGGGCQLMVSSVSDGQKMFAEPIEAGAEEATLDISALAPGLYAVSLVKEGEVTDTKCFSNK